MWHLLMHAILVCLCASIGPMLPGCRPAVLPEWQPVSDGIKRQSEVIQVTIAPDDPQAVFMLTYEPAGVYRSTDGGVSWQRRAGGLEGVTVLSLALDPLDSRTLYAGTVRGGYRSTDGGKTWQHMPSLEPSHIYALTFAPQGHTILVGTEGLGVYMSDDSGVSWSSTGLGGASVLSLAVAPSGTIYAGTSGHGIWISSDGGAQWQVAAAPLDEAHVPNLVVTNEGTVWALADGNLSLSRDEGETWRSAGPPGVEGMSMAVERQVGRVIYLGSRWGGIAASQDGGASWQVAGSELSGTDIICLTVDSEEPSTAYLGTKGDGLYKTTDGGVTWSSTSNDVGKRVVSALVKDPHYRRTLYAGTLHGVYKSANGGDSWSLLTGEAGVLYVQALAVDPQESGIIYAGTEKGVYISRDRGRSWTRTDWALGNLTIFSLTIDSEDRNIVYAGSWGNNILRTTDGGRSWEPIHHGLETLSVYSFAIDPINLRVLYAGTVEAIYKSADRGESWRRLEGMRDGITTFALAIDPTDPASVYAGTTDGVYHSNDGGETWASLHEGMGHVTVMALAVHASGSGALYAGTEHRGLFYSADAGEHWIPWGLAGRSIYAMVIDESEGAMWVATDSGVFRQGP